MYSFKGPYPGFESQRDRIELSKRTAYPSSEKRMPKTIPTNSFRQYTASQPRPQSCFDYFRSCKTSVIPGFKSQRRKMFSSQIDNDRIQLSSKNKRQKQSPMTSSCTNVVSTGSHPVSVLF